MTRDNAKSLTGQLETLATDAVAKIAPWAAPVPTAYLVGRATVQHLHWPVWVGFVAACIVESLGLATTATALTLREYNLDKRKSDPGAPFTLAAVLVGVYLLTAVGLTVALDTFPVLAVYSPAVFPLLSLCGMTVLALRADHKRRVQAVADDRCERAAQRKEQRAARAVQQPAQDLQPTARDSLTTAQRRNAVATLLQQEAHTPHELATMFAVHRTTTHRDLQYLARAEKVRLDGDGRWVAV